ncbi:MAG: LysR family transcriptional regulator [Myxococcales bacterium]|nr:LysR family transcriptional regulator [Myxococcales bacterium]
MAAFVAVVELRGFAPAARRLGLSASAVTRLVAALEQRLAARLLQRTTRSVRLTDAGARYLERARRILGDLEEAERAVMAEGEAPIGRLVVAAPNLFGRLWVAPVLSTYLARHPGVVGELTLADRNINLIDEGVDVAVRIGDLADSSLSARRVGATRRVVVGAPEYLARRGAPRTPEALAGHTTVHFNAVQRAPEWQFAGPRPRTVALAPALTTDSADAAIGHVERGGGLTRVLAYQVADAVRAGRLIVVLAEFEPPPAPIHLVVPTARLLSAKVRAFVDLVRETCDWEFVAL